MLKESNGSVAGIGVVQLPAGRKVAPAKAAEPVALTGKADTEEKAHKALKSMFQAACVNFARRYQSLKEAIETCLKAGVTIETVEGWAAEVGYSIQTFRNTMTAIRKETGEMLRIVKKDDRRLARNRKTPAEKSLEDRMYAYGVRECGSLKKAASMFLKLSRRADADAKAE